MDDIKIDSTNILTSKPQEIAQCIATGPTERIGAMSEVFQGLILSARTDLIITTPYFVPNQAIVSAICLVARFGVSVKIILPKRNDSWFVSMTSKSYYKELAEAGVEIYEYKKGLLHSKIMIVDNKLSMIGSANIDRRSFELNYENNVIIYSPNLAESLNKRVMSYIDDSFIVPLEEIQKWSKAKILWHNINATLSPLL